MSTPSQPRRIIEAAMIEGVGPIRARELLAMTDDDWGILRDRITDRRAGRPAGLVARCMMCGSKVFIKVRTIDQRKRPLFAHYKGGDPRCPWGHHSTVSMDA